MRWASCAGAPRLCRDHAASDALVQFLSSEAMLQAAAKAGVEVRRRNELSVHCASNSVEESVDD